MKLDEGETGWGVGGDGNGDSNKYDAFINLSCKSFSMPVLSESGTFFCCCLVSFVLAFCLSVCLCCCLCLSVCLPVVFPFAFAFVLTLLHIFAFFVPVFGILGNGVGVNGLYFL